MLKKYVYFFGSSQVDGDRTMRDLLGGKGAGLAEMTRAGLPVPPGFTVSTDVCRLFYSAGRRVPQKVEDEMESHLRRLEKLSGIFLGADDRPLLVSVRSGSKFSMPGMMDTILNLGLNDKAVEGLKTVKKELFNSQAAGILSKYDWYVIRNTEASTAIPSAITDYRTAVRAKCNSMQAQVDGAANVDALAALFAYTETDGVTSRPLGEWPTDPNAE